MFGKKKVEAVLESKTICESENAPLVGGSAGESILFVYAEQSKSFFSKDIAYIIAFRIGTKLKEFKVDKAIYDSLEEGKKGLLIYRGNFFEDFIVGESV